ncbi:hypothetical protein AVEN_217711-1 [Araneus ventricosus]|uniref:Uncharacterized protein n=1 Tax=Araneus ventricosus TaxID=182803 RepID=A0A4Y2NMJ2_ARAVE|nr:hypothetical protein AVEN_217711-1 [Araneus ventricosus]
MPHDVACGLVCPAPVTFFGKRARSRCTLVFAVVLDTRRYVLGHSITKTRRPHYAGTFSFRVSKTRIPRWNAPRCGMRLSLPGSCHFLRKVGSVSLPLVFAVALDSWRNLLGHPCLAKPRPRETEAKWFRVE